MDAWGACVLDFDSKQIPGDTQISYSSVDDVLILQDWTTFMINISLLTWHI